MWILADQTYQLGNRLFTAGHVIAAAIEFRTRVLNPEFSTYSHFFPNADSGIFCQFPQPAGRSQVRLGRREKWAQLFLKLALSLEKKKLRRLNGFLVKTYRASSVSQYEDGEPVRLDSTCFRDIAKRYPLLFLLGPSFECDVLFQKHSAEVRRFFAPAARHWKAAQEVVAAARENSDILCGIHIRHGDYATYLGGRFYYPLETYMKLMSMFQRLFPTKRITFLVCSTAKFVMEDFPKHPVVFAPGNMIEDLHSLSLCDYIIGPPSTFSAWASFYSSVPICRVEDPSDPLSLESFKLLFPRTP